VLSGSRDYMPLVKTTAILLVLAVIACGKVIGRALMDASQAGDATYAKIVGGIVGAIWLVAFVAWWRNARS